MIAISFEPAFSLHQEVFTPNESRSIPPGIVIAILNLTCFEGMRTSTLVLPSEWLEGTPPSWIDLPDGTYYWVSSTFKWLSESDLTSRR